MNSLGAMCSDFYVNQKIALKLDLPTGRETVLDLFDRIRREHPEMKQFRRYDGELALESPETEQGYHWAALNQTAIRSGWVNPADLSEAYRLHRLLLEVAPYYLSISPIDVEFVELVFGFDIETEANRNELVFDALLADSPLSALVKTDEETILDAQPFVGFALTQSAELQAYIEVKTRSRAREVHPVPEGAPQPISIYLTVRRYGPFQRMESFLESFGALAGHAERLAEERVIPCVVVPIRAAVL